MPDPKHVSPFLDWPDELTLVLASRSPRRADLLTVAGLPFEICPGLENDDVSRYSFQKLLEEKYLAYTAEFKETFSIEPADEQDQDPSESIAEDPEPTFDYRFAGDESDAPGEIGVKHHELATALQGHCGFPQLRPARPAA